MKNKKLIPLLLSSLLIFNIASCSSTKDEDVTYLYVYNWEDYIYIPEDEDESCSMVEQFEEFINQEGNKKLYGLTTDVKVIYDTFDTPETMYNQLKLNKTSYDIMCPSDYMIQKLALNLDGLEQTRIQKIDFSKLPNYSKYVSKFLVNNLEEVNISETDLSKGTLADYAVGYMWGTLGIQYNPGAQTLLDKGYTEEEIIEAFSAPDAWNLLWENDDFAEVASIKDSIRDTYAMGILHVYSDELEALQNDFNNKKLTSEEYRKKVNEIFNRCDEESIKKVQDALIELKDKIYGFEVDTGKTDIVTGKVAVNLAWSGDAVYSMDQAEEEYDQYFYYTIPSYGANIWFDGWCIPETCTGEKLNAAYAFLDFLSLPSNAAQNMDYIGYTSFIAGDDVLSLINDWYSADDDVSEDELDTYDITYFFEGTLEELDITDAILTIEASERSRQIHAQYPDISEIDHLCIMKDFGTANNDIVKAWENVKVNPLPVWVKVFVISSLVLFVLYLGSYPILRKITLKKRRKLREE